MGITRSRSFALSTCVLLVYLMKLERILVHNFWTILISFVCSLCYCICSNSSDCYGSFHKYVSITVVTETRIQHRGLKSNLAINFVIATRITFPSTQLFVSNLDCWPMCFWVNLWFYYSNLSSSIICSHFSRRIYFFLGIFMSA